MYKCVQCNNVFEHPAKQIDGIGYSIAICPNCSHDEIEEVSICEKCGFAATLHEKYCETCKGHIRENIHQSVSLLVNAYEYDRTEILKVIQEVLEAEG